MQNALDRIAETNPALNFCTDVYAEQALDAAREADRREPTGRLHGVPFALKDVTPARGQLVTYGSHAFDLIPSRDAVIAARLQAAGAILVARTTTPELAHSSYTRSPRFGVTRNPWDPSRTPGGSSGGSAVAVATGCVPFAEGSDMGGSIRIPASYCGIVGLKPSFGRIPLEFLPSLTDHIHHVGPLARNADDARLFLAVTQGPDDRDPLSLPGVLELDRPLSGDVRGLRLALSIDLGSYRVHPEIEAAVRRAAEALREAGAEVDEVEVRLHPRAAAGLVRPLGRVPRRAAGGAARRLPRPARPGGPRARRARPGGQRGAGAGPLQHRRPRGLGGAARRCTASTPRCSARRWPCRRRPPRRAPARRTST